VSLNFVETVAMEPVIEVEVLDLSSEDYVIMFTRLSPTSSIAIQNHASSEGVNIGLQIPLQSLRHFQVLVNVNRSAPRSVIVHILFTFSERIIIKGGVTSMVNMPGFKLMTIQRILDTLLDLQDALMV